MIPLPWTRRSTPAAGQARLAQLEREVCGRSKCGTEANIAELRAKRAQIALNSILDDVIAASISAAKGGHDDGE